ncbi:MULTISPECIES: FlhC family transcriptional regulator [Morganellaceae]|uniref:FlhC family transcriptional regulator n=1 Tax=Providencia rettgeri TaxID=587 RepID=A0AB35LEH2_PRORE|nr:MULTISPECIES: FlhC family transcriptional regulator [Morganellaceae]ELB1545970.1 hypothetical protein [Morganella morganii]EKV4067974.1 hypothetical protein [Proteus mirabilis]MCI9768597.1 hypothetical protein [Proteus mirabilis]MCI9772187.1 hypothetical protein [Proteus mirabilis]MCI9775779.1 hypothetical protein [Proteus mirabilis]
MKLTIAPEDYQLAIDMIKLGFRKNVILSEIPAISPRMYGCLRNDSGIDNEDNDFTLGRLRKISTILANQHDKRSATDFLHVYLMTAQDPENRLQIEELIGAYKAYRHLFNVHCGFFDDPLKKHIIDPNLAWQIATNYRNGIIGLTGCFECRQKYIYLTHESEDSCNMKCPYCSESKENEFINNKGE